MTQKRNSNIEMLRLVSMLAIVMHHFVAHNIDSLDTVNGSSRIILDFANILFGKIAVCIFLIITVWFLSDRSQTIQSTLHRMQVLEREVLFYSISCYLIYSFILDTFWPKMFITRFFPVITGEWWFVCAYMLLIFLLPFLCTGLKALNELEHRILTLVLLSFFGLIQFFPYIYDSALSDFSNVMGVVIITVATCYCRWYKDIITPPRKMYKLSLLPIASGLLLMISYIANMANIQPFNSMLERLWLHLQDYYSLPVIIISLSVVIALTEATPHFWPPINRFAASSLAIYLITDTPEAQKILWERLFPLHLMNNTPIPIITMLLISVVICIVCIGIDQIRSKLFHIIFD
ncbi:acyltransferase family protein [Bifidobacterium samirii]|nr:acyltransferase family protein [Bifidobacterium samirii]